VAPTTPSRGYVIGTGSGAGAGCGLVFGFEIANTASVTVNSDGTFDLNNQAEPSIRSRSTTQRVDRLGRALFGRALSMSGGSIRHRHAQPGRKRHGHSAGATASIQSPIPLNGNRTFTVNKGGNPSISTFSGVISDGGPASKLTRWRGHAGTESDPRQFISATAQVNDGVLTVGGHCGRNYSGSLFMATIAKRGVG